jgi:hypothetical protein
MEDRSSSIKQILRPRKEGGQGGANGEIIRRRRPAGYDDPLPPPAPAPTPRPDDEMMDRARGRIPSLKPRLMLD